MLTVSVASMTVSCEPKMKDLANYVAAVIPDKWMQVAVQLELDRSVIKAIRNDEDDCFKRFMAVFDHWKQSSSQPYTWKALVTALNSKSVNEFTLAKKIQQEFC